ncbi:MAG: ATP-binding cassette domain-containing protein, partial [Spirochaetales bacterium]
MSDETRVAAPIAVQCSGVGKAYRDGEAEITALSEFSFEFATGELTAVTGPSGSGKSTLLSILAAIEYADEGRVEIGATELGTLSAIEQAEFRASTISYLFPDNNLIPMLSVYENITLALSVKRLPESEVDRRTRAALSSLGI